MTLTSLILSLLPGTPQGVVTEPASDAGYDGNREIEEMLEGLIRSRLASGEATIIENDPDLAERVARDMGVTIPEGALSAAREAIAARRARASAAAKAASTGTAAYPLAEAFDAMRFRELATEAAGIIQGFCRYGSDSEAEARDGQRLIDIAAELSYGGRADEWMPGDARLSDSAYPWPELAWLPGYAIHIGKEMCRR